MKKALILLMGLILVLSLGTCGKSDAAQAVDEKIAAIGEVTLDSEALISDAELSLAALTQEEKEQLENRDILTQARAEYERLVLASQAAEIDAAIEAIGTVTLDSAEDISAARELYESSSSDVQAMVRRLADLQWAEIELSNLRVEEVNSLINAIGSVTLNSGGAIDAAREAYDGLTEEEAAKVSNLSALEDAESAFKSLRAAEILSGFTVEEDNVRGVNFYYPSVFPEYIDIRSYMLPYLGQDGDRYWLRMIANYTGDDWVFFESLLISVDGELYSRSLDYFDITRDNGGGVVWEYIDVDASNDYYTDLLWAIASSDETIVRFQGDSYYYDLTISDEDKAAIRQVLTAYDALT